MSNFLEILDNGVMILEKNKVAAVTPRPNVIEDQMLFDMLLNLDVRLQEIKHVMAQNVGAANMMKTGEYSPPFGNMVQNLDDALQRILDLLDCKRPQTDQKMLEQK